MSALSASAQTDTIRYVNIKTGKYANDGKTWTTAKDNVQDAINDLYNYMQLNNVHSGSVYVAAGTYTPSESTGDGSSVLSTSSRSTMASMSMADSTLTARRPRLTCVSSPLRPPGATVIRA